MASKLRVGVLRGGPSPEYDVSLSSGAHVIKSMPPTCKTTDIFISKDGIWHIRGEEVTPKYASDNVDVFFNCLHGQYGEDGKLQQILNRLGTPYTGSGALASAIAMSKHLSKRFYREHGLKTPMGRVVRNVNSIGSVARDVVQKTSPPWIVKPASAGSSIGVAIAQNHDELFAGLLQAFAYSDAVLIEEYVQGTEATCCVVEHGNGLAYALPPIEIRPPKDRDIFDYEIKYDGSTQEICPGNFTETEAGEIMNTAVRAHEVLGLSHYSRSDFIISQSGMIYILETNSLPGLTEQSLIMKALQAVGTSFTDFLDHVVNLAHTRK